ncbi:MAG TPA: beta-propeller fold lactonase family protein [Solirubrobacterales bacterium]|nr:beta-propeller fold lactonase family protein [Solirubrobacterales bacterium]
MPITSRSLHVRVPLIAALAVLCLALFASQASARYVYTGNYDNDNVSVIDTATNQVVGSPIPVGDGPYTMAITPNGKTLYVGNSNSDDLTIVDTQTNQPSGSIFLGISTATIAISPDGTTAYVTASGEDLIVPVNLQSNLAGTPFPVGGNPWGVAFAPDGKTAWVTNEDNATVSVIDTATRQVVGLPIPVGNQPINIVISADGKTAYVGNFESNTISVIDTASRQVVATIPVGEEPWGLGLTPDGTKLYVSNYADDNVSVIDTATRQVVGLPIPTGDEPYELAVTPDGKSVYVANYGTEDSVTVINVQTGQAVNLPVAGGPWQVAIVPDQSPVASFTATASKKQPLKLAFNGAGSTDPDGTVARWDWSFGDGATLLNGGAAPSHTYKKAGTYTAGLTVFDNEGCSGFVFTGRTAYCNGNSTLAQSLNVKAPNNFKFGKLTKNAKKGTAKLKIKLPSPGKLTLSGKQVKKVKRSAKQAATVTLNIRPKPKTKKQLAETGSAKVRIKVKFVPTGGKAKTKGKTVKLIQR